MNLLQRLAAPFKARANTDQGLWRIFSEVARDPKYSWPDLSKPEQQILAYRANPFLYATVNKIVTSAAAVSMEVYRRKGEEEQEIEDHPIEQLLAKPNVLNSYQSLMKATLTYLLTTGNAYWYLAGGTQPTEIYNLRSDRVWIAPGDTPHSPVMGYAYRIRGLDIPLEEPNVIHFKLLDPWDDFYGLSPIYTLWKAVQTDQAMAQWNFGFFGQNNAVPSSIVSLPPTMSNTDYERAKNEWKQHYGGNEQATAFIRGDQIKVETLTPSHVDMNFLDGRVFNREVIERVYGIAGGLSDKSATRANSDSAYTQFLDEVVYPHMNSIAEMLTVRLAPLYGTDLCIEAEDIRQKDNADERAEIEIAKQFFTVNEIRKTYFQEDDIEGGDVPAAIWNSPVQAAPALPDSTMPPPDNQPPQLPPPPKVPELPPGEMPPKESKALDEEDIIYPRVEHTASMKRQLQQFVTLVGKDKTYDGFEFHQAPYSLDLMAKSWADTLINEYAENAPIETYQKALGEAMHWIRLLDPRHTIKTEQSLSRMPDGSFVTDPLAMEKSQSERALTQVVADALEAVKLRVISNTRQAASNARKSGIPGNLEDYTNYFDDKFWAEMLDLMDRSIRPTIQDITNKAALKSGENLRKRGKFGVGLDPTVFNAGAADYARQFTDDVLKGYNTTTQKGVGAILSRWIGSEGATFGDLVTALETSPAFSLKRAELTAVTEMGRAFAYAEDMAGEELATEANVPFKAKGLSIVPAHVGCYCWETTDPVFDAAGRLIAIDTVFHSSNQPNTCPICERFNGRYLSEIAA